MKMHKYTKVLMFLHKYTKGYLNIYIQDYIYLFHVSRVFKTRIIINCVKQIISSKM